MNGLKNSKLICLLSISAQGIPGMQVLRPNLSREDKDTDILSQSVTQARKWFLHLQLNWIQGKKMKANKREVLGRQEFWLIQAGSTVGSHCGPCPLAMQYGLCIGQRAFGRCPRVEKEFNFSLDFEHDAFKILMRYPRNVQKAAAYVDLGSEEISRLGM